MSIEKFARLDRNIHRARDVVSVLAKYSLASWLKDVDLTWVQDRLTTPEGQSIADLRLEERVRLALTELGTTFIKLGQMLATRADLLGPAMTDELARLQTDVPADPPAAVHAMLEAELGAPPGQLFAAFADVPVASASIAQVHAAQLRSGEAVVVKVQHAGIEERIVADLDALATVADLAAKYAPALRPYQPVEIVRQFRRTLLRELDFTIERRNLETFGRNFAGDDTVRFPRPVAASSSRRVLTMERLDGILGTDVDVPTTSGVDLDEFARRGATMYLHMVFRDGFYHADPHPGNLMLMPGGVVGVLDCGMVGRFDEQLSEDLDDLLGAVANRSAVDLEEALVRVSTAPPTMVRDQLRADLADFIGDYVGRSIQELDLSAALNSVFAIIRRHSIALPPPLSLLLRTLVELEGTAQRLSPQFSLTEVIEPFYHRMERRRLSPRRFVARLRHSYGEWERLAGTLPRDLNEALRRARDGTFSVHLDVRRIDQVVNRLVLGIITAALFMGSSLLWATRAAPTFRNISVVGAAGYALATYFGWRLLRALKKSGDIAGVR